MSNIIQALQSASKSMWASGADVNINVGCGNSNINVAANNANISTGCGDQNITAVVSGTANISTGCCGDDNVIVYGNLANTTGTNSVSTGGGDDSIVVLANNVTVNKGTGSLILGAIGNNYTVNSFASSNVIGAYGDNYQFNLQNTADNDVRTLDYWLRDGQDGKTVELDDGSRASLKDIVTMEDENGNEMTLNQYDNSTDERKANVQFFKDNFADLFDTLTYSGTTTTSEVIATELTSQNKDEIADKYNLSAKEREILNSVDLNAKYSDGSSLYSIVYSPRRKQYVVCKRDGATHTRAVYDNECIAFKNASNNTYVENYKNTILDTTTTSYTTAGVSNWTVNAGNGNLTALISARSGQVNVNAGSQLGTRNVLVTGGHVDSTVSQSTSYSYFQKLVNVFGSGTSWNSPLVLDMNGDGKVSATAGTGVDINNDGKADGAATNGDKMLAMTDLNGNGSIDGAEVFGDQTVSPFTGEKLNASNGFEALEMIAKEAEEYTGINCMDGSNVDVQKLAEALAKVGVKLGFISDNNTTEVEDLSGVKTIDVDNYKEVDETGTVQNRQQGSFTTENGETRKIDDVWFAV